MGTIQLFLLELLVLLRAFHTTPMLRLALARPSSRTLPAFTRWRRLNTTLPACVYFRPGTSLHSPILYSAGVVAPAPDTPSATIENLQDAAADATSTDLDEIHAFARSLDLDDTGAGSSSGTDMDDLNRSFDLDDTLDPDLLRSFDLTGLDGPLDPDLLPRRVSLDAFNGTFTEEQYASTLVHGRSIFRPFVHPRTHSIPVASIHFRSHHPRLLDLFTHVATHAASSLGIPISGPVMLPTKRTLWTVIRSPFAHKKSQENFERKVHKRAIKAWDADQEVVERWVKYLRSHAMGGVGMRVTRWERVPLGIGRTALEGVQGRLEAGKTETSAGKIKKMGEKIVVEEISGLGAQGKEVAQVQT